jgi:hypothetical protein
MKSKNGLSSDQRMFQTSKKIAKVTAALNISDRA